MMFFLWVLKTSTGFPDVAPREIRTRDLIDYIALEVDGLSKFW